MDVVPGMLQGDTRGGQRSDRRGHHGEDRGDDHDGPERSGELTAGDGPTWPRRVSGASGETSGMTPRPNFQRPASTFEHEGGPVSCGVLSTRSRD